MNTNMKFNPTREEITQAWKHFESGNSVSEDMRKLLEKLNHVVASENQELTDEIEYQKAIALAKQYDECVIQLAVLSDKTLTRLAEQFPHVSRAAHGNRTRDRNKRREERRKAEMSEIFQNITAPKDMSPRHLTNALLDSIRKK